MDECPRVLVDEVDAEAAHFESQVEKSTPREKREDRVAHTHYADSLERCYPTELVRASKSQPYRHGKSVERLYPCREAVRIARNPQITPVYAYRVDVSTIFADFNVFEISHVSRQSKNS